MATSLDERQHRRALRRFLRAEIGVRRLDAAAHASPEVELPREIAGDPRSADTTSAGTSRARPDSCSRTPFSVTLGSSGARATPTVGAELLDARSGQPQIAVLAERDVDQRHERRIADDVEPRHGLDRLARG